MFTAVFKEKATGRVCKPREVIAQSKTAWEVSNSFKGYRSLLPKCDFELMEVTEGEDTAVPAITQVSEVSSKTREKKVAVTLTITPPADSKDKVVTEDFSGMPSATNYCRKFSGGWSWEKEDGRIVGGKSKDGYVAVLKWLE